MDNINHKEIFFNRAEVKEAEHIHCENCFEQVVFLLRDNNHEFSMGLKSVLECVMFAIKNGHLPELPLSWLASVDDVYRTKFAFDEDLCYNDYDNNRKRE